METPLSETCDSPLCTTLLIKLSKDDWVLSRLDGVGATVNNVDSGGVVGRAPRELWTTGRELDSLAIALLGVASVGSNGVAEVAEGLSPKSEEIALVKICNGLPVSEAWLPVLVSEASRDDKAAETVGKKPEFWLEATLFAELIIEEASPSNWLPTLLAMELGAAPLVDWITEDASPSNLLAKLLTK